MNVNKHLCRVDITVMVRLRNVLKKCIIKVTNSNVSFVFFQACVMVPRRSAIYNTLVNVVSNAGVYCIRCRNCKLKCIGFHYVALRIRV